MKDFIKYNKINMIVDASFGSTGKGLIAARIASDNEIHIAGTTTSPNAGHTFYIDNKKYVTHLIPVAGIIHDRSAIVFSSESVIDPDLLEKEMNEFNIDESRVFIHPRSPIITQEDKDIENTPGGVERIASTQSGVGSARARKVMRTGTLAENYLPFKDMCRKYPWKRDLTEVKGLAVLVETGQGFGLDINHGFAYPYCTSRSILPATILGELGLHPKWMGNCLFSFRTYPIRVGNPIRDGREVGYSGPFYPGSTEINFSDLGVKNELTTVTKRIRRIATFSMEQYISAIEMIEPTHIFLNFCNYYYNREEDIPTFPKKIYTRLYWNRSIYKRCISVGF